MFHPADTEHLYPAGERNSSAVYSLVNFCASPDTANFPKLCQARPHSVIVGEGDLLYLPCGWWHAVRGSQELNLSINYWFALHDMKADLEGSIRNIMHNILSDATP